MSMIEDMRKERDSIELLEQYALGSMEYDLLKAMLTCQDETIDTEESVTLFEMAIQSLEIGYWKSEIGKIAMELS